MPGHDQRRQRVENLLSQDTELTDDTLRRQRMALEQTLIGLEERARSIRRASFIGVGVTIACMLSVLPLEGLRLTQWPWVAPLWATVTNLAFITTAALLTLYWHKYRPAIDRQRSDIQMSVLADIQRQVAELRSEIHRRDKSEA